MFSQTERNNVLHAVTVQLCERLGFVMATRRPETTASELKVEKDRPEKKVQDARTPTYFVILRVR